MIPTLIVLGIVFGRWWRWAVPILALLWAATIVVFVDGGRLEHFVGAAALAVANVVVGVFVYQAIAWPIARLWRLVSASPSEM